MLALAERGAIDPGVADAAIVDLDLRGRSALMGASLLHALSVSVGASRTPAGLVSSPGKPTFTASDPNPSVTSQPAPASRAHPRRGAETLPDGLAGWERHKTGWTRDQRYTRWRLLISGRPRVERIVSCSLPTLGSRRPRRCFREAVSGPSIADSHPPLCGLTMRMPC